MTTQRSRNDQHTGRVPSLRDVASLAGVSMSSVSLVVNGKAEGRVSAGNQTAVRAAVEQLGYRPDPVARGLATGRRGTIAVIVPDLDSLFFNFVTAGIADVLADNVQMLLAFASHDDHGLEETFGRILAMRVDGIICVGVGAEALRTRRDITCPVVLIDYPDASSGRPQVTFDFAGAAEQVVDHLASLGHRRIAFLTAAFDAPTFGVRLRLIREHLTARMGRRARLVIGTSETTTAAADEAVTGYWPDWSQLGVTALICATDMQAYGALLALERLAVAVPGDCSVLGFDNLPFSALTRPALSSVSLPARELGTQAAQMLTGLVGHAARPADSSVLPAALVVRESTGPAPTR